MDKLLQKEFFEKTPPGVKVIVTDLEYKEGLNTQAQIYTPDIELHCPECQGFRFFATTSHGRYVGQKKPFDEFVVYFCRNCSSSVKTFAIYGIHEGGNWQLVKYGELPAFGPPVPARVFKLIGEDRSEFLKGRRCENQGLGVAAFAYYRRVVENQKARIFDEVIRVARHLSEDIALIQELEAAKNEVQFTKAVDSIKHALPQSLLINGYNPLTLLHSPLSEGLHALSDEECLELAASIRVVLIEFSERLAIAMKDEAELNDAVNRLAGKRKPSSQLPAR